MFYGPRTSECCGARTAWRRQGSLLLHGSPQRRSRPERDYPITKLAINRRFHKIWTLKNKPFQPWYLFGLLSVIEQAVKTEPLP